MQYQTFRGADVQEALFNVREALGADALIESTRHVVGAPGRPMVEIVAAPSLVPSNRAQTASAIARASRLAERARARAQTGRTAAPHEELHSTALGREIVQLRLMLD